MHTLEGLLAAKFLAKKQQNKIISSNIVTEEDTDKVYLLIEINTTSSKQLDKIKTKIYKQDITKYILLHGSLENFYKALVVSDMILSGYLLVPIEGGYICTGGEEIYSLLNNQCTCPAFLNNSNNPCKHLLYRDGLLNQRAKINNWKLNNINQ